MLMPVFPFQSLNAVDRTIPRSWKWEYVTAILHVLLTLVFTPHRQCIVNLHDRRDLRYDGGDKGDNSSHISLICAHGMLAYLDLIHRNTYQRITLDPLLPTSIAL